MRFFLFNLVVAGALVYLAANSQTNSGAIAERFAPEEKSEEKNEEKSSVNIKRSALDAKPVKKWTGENTVQTVRKPEPAKKPKAAASKPPPKPESWPEAGTEPGVNAKPAKRAAPKKPNDGAALAANKVSAPLSLTPSSSLPADVARRRTEVLGDPASRRRLTNRRVTKRPADAWTPPQETAGVVLEGETRLMSREERARSLRGLIDEMELRFPERTGD